MKHDETNFNGGGETGPHIEPELEARLLAWIAGEASPAESAALERLVQARPELAQFKTRFADVGRLVSEAVSADSAPLRLAPERRAQLLRALSEPAVVTSAAAPTPAASASQPLSERIATLPKVISPWSWRAPRIYFALSGAAAACLVAVLIFAYPKAKTPVYSATATMQFEKPETVINMQQVSDASVRSDVDINTYAQLLQSMANRNNELSRMASQATPEQRKQMAQMEADLTKKRQAEGIVFASHYAAAPAAAAMEPLSSPSAAQTKEDGPVRLDKFVVSESRDAFGFGGSAMANNTSGARSTPSVDTTSVAAGLQASLNQAMQAGSPGSSVVNESNSLNAGYTATSGSATWTGSGTTGTVNASTDRATLVWGAAQPGSVTLSSEASSNPANNAFGGAPAASVAYAGATDGSTSSNFNIASGKTFNFKTLLGGSIAKDTSVDGRSRSAENSIFAGLADVDRRTVILSTSGNITPTPGLVLSTQPEASFYFNNSQALGLRDFSDNGTVPAAVFGPATVNPVLGSSWSFAQSVPEKKAASDVSPEVTGLNLGKISMPAVANLSFAAASVNGDIVDSGVGGVIEKRTTAGSGAALDLRSITTTGEVIGNLSAIAGSTVARGLAVSGDLQLSPGGGAISGVSTTSGSLLPGNLNVTGLPQPLPPPQNAAKLDQPVVRAPEPLPAVAESGAAQEPVSTFSLHVSDVSFRLAQAAGGGGERPAADRIRAEEFYNAFNYGDPAPAMAEKIGARIEQAAHPLMQQRNLVRIALKVPATGRGAGTPLRLTVLLDTSGSMEREDRVAAVRRALEVLVSLLGPADRITLIGFARQPRLLAESLPGDQARQLLDIVARIPAEGGTNLEEALKLGGELATRQQLAGAQNRLVLLTDGAANLGSAEPAQLATAIGALRQRGIAFDACGVGLDGLDDAVLEALTRQGDGRYYVLNSPEDADAGFARQLAGAFRPAAENVKVQVRFNPARVGRYRLIGFEQHRLRTEDFRNDQVDAAELAAEEAAVALYQVEPLPQGAGDLGEVSVRFRDAATGQMVERAWTMVYDAAAPAFDRATPTLQLAGTAALLAEKLRGGDVASQIKLGDLAAVVNGLRGHFAHEPRVQELTTMFAQARRLLGE